MEMQVWAYRWRKQEGMGERARNCGYLLFTSNRPKNNQRVDNLATLIFSRTQLVRPTVLVISANEV